LWQRLKYIMNMTKFRTNVVHEKMALNLNFVTKYTR